jgi:hypothetical protein
MRFFIPSGAFAVFAAVLCQGASGQNAPGKAAQAIEAPSLPPRGSPAEYQAHAQTGAVTVAAEFTGHSIITPLATFTTEEYIAVEVALFGPPGTRLKLSHEDFSLRVNGKKALPAQHYLLLSKSLKDPEYVPPEPPPAKSDDAGVAVAGSKPSDRNPQWHPVPFEVTHRMETRVEKASLPEGDHALPEAGLIFFRYSGRDNGISSVELVYDGPAGRASLPIHL